MIQHKWKISISEGLLRSHLNSIRFSLLWMSITNKFSHLQTIQLGQDLSLVTSEKWLNSWRVTMVWITSQESDPQTAEFLNTLPTVEFLLINLLTFKIQNKLKPIQTTPTTSRLLMSFKERIQRPQRMKTTLMRSKLLRNSNSKSWKN